MGPLCRTHLLGKPVGLLMMRPDESASGWVGGWAGGSADVSRQAGRAAVWRQPLPPASYNVAQPP